MNWGLFNVYYASCKKKKLDCERQRKEMQKKTNLDCQPTKDVSMRWLSCAYAMHDMVIMCMRDLTRDAFPTKNVNETIVCDIRFMLFQPKM